MTEKFWMQVINTVSDGIFMVDANGRICQANNAICELTGYSREELLGQPCSIFECTACAAVREETARYWCNLFALKQVLRRRCNIRHKDGEWIPILKNAHLLASEDGPLNDQGVFSVETVTDIRELVHKDEYIQKVERLLHPTTGFQGMVSSSAAMRRVFTLVEQAAKSSVPVLIMGESGTGKELVARALHNLSARRTMPYVELNCAALNEHILESELFGHVKGSFTGASRDRIGRFEAASGGTLFLDEIGDIPMPMQVKILRVLETGVIQRVGDNKSHSVDVRIVSATNRNLAELIEQGQFREDLAFRINVFPINLPPLRDRVEDIPLLADHFIRSIRELSGQQVQAATPELLRFFMRYNWPGNVRQLKNVLEYGAVLAGGGYIGLEHMPEYLMHEACGGNSCPPTILTPPEVYTAQESAPRALKPADQEKRREICAVLASTGGNVTQAAKKLGIHRTTLINRMLRLDIQVRKDINVG